MAPSYLIAATPRSGSFLLSEGLAHSGLAGRPQEYASRQDVLTWRDYYRCSSHVEYFLRYVHMCSTRNRVFAAKLMPSQFLAWIDDARRYLGVHGTHDEVLRSLIGPFAVVRLVRQNRLRQAVSWLRARSSGSWGQAPAEVGPQPDGTRRDYDAVALEVAIRALLEQEACWDRTLLGLGAPVSIVTYEELASNYRNTVRRTLDFLRAPAAAPVPAVPRRRRQADETTERWVERALHELDPELLERCGARVLEPEAAPS